MHFNLHSCNRALSALEGDDAEASALAVAAGWQSAVPGDCEQSLGAGATAEIASLVLVPTVERLLPALKDFREQLDAAKLGLEHEERQEREWREANPEEAQASDRIASLRARPSRAEGGGGGGGAGGGGQQVDEQQGRYATGLTVWRF